MGSVGPEPENRRLMALIGVHMPQLNSKMRDLAF
jgi:hypothetical protein